ncbi:hypothetical protein JHK86_004578 [Glycine max]|nr:hypothetical protein JHK86_004578 [Glycine max]
MPHLIFIFHIIPMDSENVPNLSDVTKKTKGRQKIEMKTIANKCSLQVTFSKHRTGVFKKASELATLCGVDLAVIMFSPNNHVYSFGSPNVDSVIQRYTTEGPPPLFTQDLNEAPCTMDEGELQAHLNCLSNQIDAEKQRVEDLNHLLMAAKDHIWWDVPIESMSNAQLEKYHKMLKEIKLKHMRHTHGE